MPPLRRSWRKDRGWMKKTPCNLHFSLSDVIIFSSLPLSPPSLSPLPPSLSRPPFRSPPPPLPRALPPSHSLPPSPPLPTPCPLPPPMLPRSLRHRLMRHNIPPLLAPRLTTSSRPCQTPCPTVGDVRKGGGLRLAGPALSRPFDFRGFGVCGSCIYGIPVSTDCFLLYVRCREVQ